MTPPLDAERVSDERLAELIAQQERLVAKQISPDTLRALRELQRLRATQRESGGVPTEIAAAIERAADRISELAFSMPAPNTHTPGFVGISIALRTLAARTLSASQRKECDECSGKGYYEGMDGNTSCEACNGTGQRKETP